MKCPQCKEELSKSEHNNLSLICLICKKDKKRFIFDIERDLSLINKKLILKRNYNLLIDQATIINLFIEVFSLSGEESFELASFGKFENTKICDVSFLDETVIVKNISEYLKIPIELTYDIFDIL